MLLIALAAAVAHPERPTSPVIGTWINRRGTVAIATSRCGGDLCGRVVWAAREAQQAAAAGGTPHLVGTTILRGFRQTGERAWAGEVFIPDIGQTADAEMTLVGRDEIEVNGCQFGGLLCKKQVWHRGPVSR